MEDVPLMTSSLQEPNDNKSWMIVVATIALTLSSKLQPSSSRSPLSPRGHDMMTNHNTRHGIVSFDYCAYGVMEFLVTSTIVVKIYCKLDLQTNLSS